MISITLSLPILLSAVSPDDPNWLPSFLACWNDPNCDERAMLQQAILAEQTEPNIPPDPNWIAVRAVALQNFCDNWLRRARVECIEYVWKPNRFAIIDDPNLWRSVQPDTARIIRWDYDPNGIRVKDYWIRYNEYDGNKDGIVNLKDWTADYAGDKPDLLR